MAMKYEQIKSIVLTLLVVSSIFLTWNLWSYQPNLEPIEESNITEDILISSKKEINETVLPYKLLYHRGGNTFGSHSQFEIKSMVNQMSSWDVYEVSDISGSLTDAEFKDLVHGEDRVEIIFPDMVSFQVYNGILRFQEKSIPNDLFDRIIVKTKNDSDDFAKVYFVLYGSQKVYESSINSSSLQAFQENFVFKALSHDEYFGYDFTEERRIYLPENSLELNSYSYITEAYSLKQFVNGLFSNPTLVSNELTNTGEEYNDDTNLMRENSNTKTFSFVNTEEEADGEASVTNLIMQSTDFINDHGGWPLSPADYQYFSINKPQRLVQYRMFVQDLPVFNESGMAEMNTVLGKVNIYKYSRPYIRPTDMLTLQTQSVTLPSGTEVLNRLLEDNIKPEQIEAVIPGFKLSNNPNAGVSNAVILEPAWYYKYAGAWIRIQTEDVGGVPLGLE
jgi:regulatory protein YycH of two-component signal transduction system YycFG